MGCGASKKVQAHTPLPKALPKRQQRKPKKAESKEQAQAEPASKPLSKIESSPLDTSHLDSPIYLEAWDHYTLICPDAKKTADFHTEQLGFKLKKIQPVNTGTVPKGEFDMINYILIPPCDPQVSLVVTEGLNPDTVFQKYLHKYGQGLHHVAFRVQNVEAAFAAVRGAGYKTTTDKITFDPLSGLKQFFVDRSHAGFFLELIERSEKKPEIGEFVHDNMAVLANSMNPILEADAEKGESDSNQDHQGEWIQEVPQVGKVSEIDVLLPPAFDAASSAKFLSEVLGFRVIRARDGEFSLDLPLRPSPLIVCRQDPSRPPAQEFATLQIVHQTDTAVANQDEEDLFEAFHYTYTSYPTRYATADTLAARKRLVAEPSTECLAVPIAKPVPDVLEFLSNVDNLRLWTCHKSLRQVAEGKWVEVRMGPDGKLADLAVEATLVGDSVTVRWPDAGRSVVFTCSALTAGYSQVLVRLQADTPAPTLSKLKRILTVELEVLKGHLEGNTELTVPDSDWHEIQAYHVALYSPGAKQEGHGLAQLFRHHGFQGEVVDSGERYEKMATDFALTVRTEPLAVLQPTTEEDVQAAISACRKLKLKIAARGGAVSHSAGGQAQADGGVVLDLSKLDEVVFERDDLALVGPGCQWHTLISATIKRGFIPPVTTDYQYLTVGGTISMGGIGYMTHSHGLQASNVTSLRVVTGRGDVCRCAYDAPENSDLFDLCRAGLGQCGVITQLGIPLIRAPETVHIKKVFYRTAEMPKFVTEMQRLVSSVVSKGDSVHAFLKPCTKEAMIKMVGSEALAAAPKAFRNALLEGEKQGELLVLLEVALTGGQGRDRPPAELFRKCSHVAGHCFESSSPYMEYITRDPPVIETNKKVGSVPHPSASLVLPGSATKKLLKHWTLLDPSKRGPDAYNEVLVMPVVPAAMTQYGQGVPMFPLPESAQSTEVLFFLLFLGSAVPASAGRIAEVTELLREVNAKGEALGGKRYSYDTITHSVRGEAAWSSHFGKEQWERLKQGKRKHDPDAVLGAGLFFWDSEDGLERADSRDSGKSAAETTAGEKEEEDVEGPTVWQEFAALANETGGINLGQGYPNWSPPQFILDASVEAMKQGTHQYTRPAGHPPLIKQLAIRYSEMLHRQIDAETEIATTVGAAQALFLIMQSFLHQNDEALLFEPCFDLYLGQSRLAHGKAVPVPMHLNSNLSWELDIQALRDAITPRSKVLVINTPHNPTGKVFTRQELEAIAEVVREYPRLVVVADEVYGHMVYGDNPIVHFATLEGMWERTLTVSSVGKTFSVTGWQVGWIVGPNQILQHVHHMQPYVQFCAASPMQEAAARVMEHAGEAFQGKASYYDWLRSMYAAKMEKLKAALESADIIPLKGEGGVFIMGDTRNLRVPAKYLKESTPGKPVMTRDWACCRWLALEFGIIAIPCSSFFSEQSQDKAGLTFVRFAFCKTDETLDAAAEAFAKVGAYQKAIQH